MGFFDRVKNIFRRELPPTPTGGFVPIGSTPTPAESVSEATTPSAPVPIASSPTTSFGRDSGGGGGGGSIQSSIAASTNIQQQTISGVPTARDISSQLQDSGGIGESRIEPFDPLKTALPRPSISEISGGGSVRSFFSDIGGDISSRARGFFNVRTQEDLERQISGRRGVPVSGAGLGSILLTSIPTGTVIDPGSGIKEKVTFKRRVEEQAILGGGAGTPAEFIAQDISFKVSQKAQRELDKGFSKVQQEVSAGEISLSEGRTRLDKITGDIQKQSEKEFSSTLSTDPTLRAKGVSEASLTKFRETQQLDVVSPAIAAGLIGGSFVAPVLTGGLISGLGAKEATTGFGKAIGGTQLTTSQRALEAGKGTVGLGLVAFGVGGSFGALRSQIAREEVLFKLEGLKQQEFKFAEVRLPEGNKQLSLLKGTKEFRGFNQKTDIVSGIFKEDGKFFIKGEGVSKVTGVLESGFVTDPKQLFLTGERFTITSSGVGAPISETASVSLAKSLTTPLFKTGALVDIAKTTPRKALLKAEKGGEILGKQFVKNLETGGTKITEFTGGSSIKLTEDTFLSRGGKITSFNLFPDEQIGFELGLDIEATGVTKVIRPPTDTGVKIFRSLGGPKTSLTETFLEAPALQSIVPKSLGNLGGLGAKVITTPKTGLVTGALVTPSTQKFFPGAVPFTKTPSEFGFKLGTITGGGDLLITGSQERLFGPGSGGLELAPVGPKITGRRSELISIPKSPTSQFLDLDKGSLALGSGSIVSQIGGLGLAQGQRSKLKQENLLEQELTFFSPTATPTGTGFSSSFFDAPRGFFFGFPGLPSERPGRKRITKGRKKGKAKIRPSLTGISRFQFGGITGPLPKGLGSLGVLPSQIRLVPKIKKTKKKKKKKK